jgi:hypothetical protein
VPRSTWRHGVSFQHDNYGDAAPDVDTEHTTRRGGPGGQLSAVIQRDYHFYGHTASGRLRHREASRGGHGPAREKG